MRRRAKMIIWGVPSIIRKRDTQLGYDREILVHSHRQLKMEPPTPAPDYSTEHKSQPYLAGMIDKTRVISTHRRVNHQGRSRDVEKIAADPAGIVVCFPCVRPFFANQLADIPKIAGTGGNHSSY